MKLLKKNSFLLGIITAAIAPIILYFGLDLINDALHNHYNKSLPSHSLMLISIFMNLVIFYTYIHKPNYDKTGRGVMISTFLYTFAYIFWRFKDFFLS